MSAPNGSGKWAWLVPTLLAIIALVVTSLMADQKNTERRVTNIEVEIKQRLTVIETLLRDQNAK
jgi:sensor domain CHASE-containing protein